MQKLTSEWVKKAEGDYRAAALLAQGSVSLHDQVCFHCQQCAEKYLKALLQELGLPVPRTHSLLALRNLLLDQHPSLRPMRRSLEFLSRFAVGPRYPLFQAKKRQALAAIRWTERVRVECRTLLGIKPVGRRNQTP